jgi:PAS domain S-box-containing protein
MDERSQGASVSKLEKMVVGGGPAKAHDLPVPMENFPGIAITMSPRGELEYTNRRAAEYFGKTLDVLQDWARNGAIHPDDLPNILSAWRRLKETGCELEFPEHRLRRADGMYRWFQATTFALRDVEGHILHWLALFTDIDEHKRAVDRLRRSEAALLNAQELAHTGSWSLEIASGLVGSSPEMFRVFEVQPGDDVANPRFWFDRIHPDDRERVMNAFETSVRNRSLYEAHYRLLLPNGSIKYQHSIGRPVLDDAGNLVEFVGAAIDTTAQSLARQELEGALEEINTLKDRLHEENLALREQINQDFMFEEIIGSSTTLYDVFSKITMVAPADSTVLITGETGTGKELIARAIHKRSKRASHAFVAVHCAALPSSLIASELFGHEKGAFTGALQRRRGRFELAHRGTIFFDEIGELPLETQTALLRILQERQFERIGGDQLVTTDVRVIAATNRDLSRSVAQGAFREDLFYRLNVFPIRVPPLRERVGDIPALIEHFVRRYSEKAGKQIDQIGKKTLDLCRAYHWPGNVRELQNIVERSVILATARTLDIDEAWISSPGSQSGNQLSSCFDESLTSWERNVIESALSATGGRIAGPRGAAAKLGIPRSTLDWKIKHLKIDKARFKP